MHVGSATEQPRPSPAFKRCGCVSKTGGPNLRSAAETVA